MSSPSQSSAGRRPGPARSSRFCCTSAHQLGASVDGMGALVLFLGLTGLAVGLAPKERRYARLRFAPMRRGSPAPRRGLPVEDSAVVNGGIVATSKIPARSQSYGKRQLTG